MINSMTSPLKGWCNNENNNNKAASHHCTRTLKQVQCIINRDLSVHPLFTSDAVFMTFSLFSIRSLNRDCFSWKWWWKSFTVNGRLKSRIHEHHQMLHFLPWEAFNAAAFSWCLFVGLSVFSLLFNNWKALLCWDQMTDLPDEESLMPLPWETLGSCKMICPFALGSTVWSVVEHVAENENIAMYTSKLILLLVSAGTSSLNTSDPIRQPYTPMP